MKKYKNVAVLGKFMPPHKGHEYLIRFAKEYSENLYVLVDCLKEETISPELRKTWLEEQIKDVKVIALKEYTPQQPEEHPDFWNYWKNTIQSAIEEVGGEKPDLLIAGMDYGWDLAKVLECDFIPIDRSRETFPISATQLRQDIFQHWDFLMDSAKPHFMKKICFVGPESTGKSTCAKNIANYFNTVYISEYAKDIIEKQNGEFFYSNVETVAFAQSNKEQALGRFANKIMVCDTDPLTTLTWSNTLFNKVPDSVIELVKEKKYDMTFLFDVDVPFVHDIHRQLLNNPEETETRQKFFNEIKANLEQLNRPYIVVSGDYEQRFEFVRQWLENTYKLSNKTKVKYE